MIVVSLPDRELAGILEELAMDDTVDLLEELPAGVVKRVLKTPGPRPAGSSTSSSNIRSSRWAAS